MKFFNFTQPKSSHMLGEQLGKAFPENSIKSPNNEHASSLVVYACRKNQRKYTESCFSQSST